MKRHIDKNYWVGQKICSVIYNGNTQRDSYGLTNILMWIKYRKTRFLMFIYIWCQTSLEAQLVKNLPEVWETLGSIPGLGRPPWRREWLSTPVFWPGEFHGLYSQWDHKQSDTTEWLSLHFTYIWYKTKERKSVQTLELLITHTQNHYGPVSKVKLHNYNTRIC